MIRTLLDRLGLLELALVVFGVVGVALTAVAGYAVVSTLDLPISGSPGLAVAVLSGVSLVTFVVVVSKVFRRRGPYRVH